MTMPLMKNPARLGLASLLALAAIHSAACTATTSDTTDGGGGGGGGDAGACSSEGTGTITVTVNGLPAGVDAKIKVTGVATSDVTATQSLSSAAAGSYTVTAERVASADPIVRALYEPTVSVASFCLVSSATQAVEVTYAPIPSSNKLWSTNANATGDILAFKGADLAASGARTEEVNLTGPGGVSVVFDKDGNMWAIGPTVSDVPLVRFPASQLGTSGAKEPDRKVNPLLTGCSPGLSALAFDASGALWSTITCSDQILRIPPEKLAASGEYTPDAGDFGGGLDKPHQLAFDKDGNLWVSSFGGNIVYKLTPADLTSTTPVKPPSVLITLPVNALPVSLAFDDGGGLWTQLGAGQLGRIAPTQLGTSTDGGAPTMPQTIVSASSYGSGTSLAFFPAAANLPIYSRF